MDEILRPTTVWMPNNPVNNGDKRAFPQLVSLRDVFYQPVLPQSSAVSADMHAGIAALSPS